MCSLLPSNRENLISHIPTCIFLVSSSCPVALARILSTMETKSDKSGHHGLIPDTQEVLPPPLSARLAMGLPDKTYITHMLFTMLRSIFSVHTIFSAVSWRHRASIHTIMWLLPSGLFISSVPFTDLHVLNQARSTEVKVAGHGVWSSLYVAEFSL